MNVKIDHSLILEKKLRQFRINTVNVIRHKGLLSWATPQFCLFSVQMSDLGRHLGRDEDKI